MQYDFIGTDEQKEYAEVIGDVTVEDLLSKSPAQVGAWVQSNASDTAAIRVMLVTIMKLLVVLLKRIEASK